MAGKVIHSVIECGWRISSICFHPNKAGVVEYNNCNPVNEQNFPSECPLDSCPDSKTKDVCETCSCVNTEKCIDYKALGLS